MSYPSSPATHQPELAAMVAAYNQMNHYGCANGMALVVPGLVTVRKEPSPLPTPGTAAC